MELLRVALSKFAALASAVAAAGVVVVGSGGALVVAGSAVPSVMASENRPFTSSDVFSQSQSLARGARQWENIQRWLDKPAPRLEVDPFVAMSTEFPAKDLNAYRGQIMVLDFWGTWCPPCIRGMPKMSEFAQKYKERGVVVLGICNQNRGETMEQTAKKAGMLFPTAFDREDKARAAFGVQWWPYYVIVDREGVVRAAGVSPAHIESVVDGILRYQPEAPAGAGAPAGEGGAAPGGGAGDAAEEVAAETIRAEWLEGSERQRQRLSSIEGQPAPALAVEQWMNVEEAYDAEKLKGKVVMVSFWATWCRHCRTAVPTMNALHEKYADKGLVIVGVCAQRGHDQMAVAVEELGMKYPVAADTVGRTTRDYRVDGYPDYYFIDRAGVLRVADVNNANVEDVIKALLAEDQEE